MIMVHIGGDWTPDQFDPYAEHYLPKKQEKSGEDLLAIIAGFNKKIGGEDLRDPLRKAMTPSV